MLELSKTQRVTQTNTDSDAAGDSATDIRIITVDLKERTLKV